MIVVPVVLKTLLKEIDGQTGSELALRFAEHVTARISEPGRARVEDYLKEARAVLTLDQGYEALRSSQSAVRQLSWDAGSPAEGKAIALAINATYCGLQRQLEEAGLAPRQRYQPSSLDIARDAQDVAKKLAAESGVEDPAIAGYEEARWQLIELIRCVPVGP